MSADNAIIIAELNRAKVAFQLRAIEAVLGIPASPGGRSPASAQNAAGPTVQASFHATAAAMKQLDMLRRETGA